MEDGDELEQFRQTSFSHGGNNNVTLVSFRPLDGMTDESCLSIPYLPTPHAYPFYPATPPLVVPLTRFAAAFCCAAHHHRHRPLQDFCIRRALPLAALHFTTCLPYATSLPHLFTKDRALQAFGREGLLRHHHTHTAPTTTALIKRSTHWHRALRAATCIPTRSKTHAFPTCIYLFLRLLLPSVPHTAPPAPFATPQAFLTAHAFGSRAPRSLPHHYGGSGDPTRRTTPHLLRTHTRYASRSLLRNHHEYGGYQTRQASRWRNAMRSARQLARLSSRAPLLARYGAHAASRCKRLSRAALFNAALAITLQQRQASNRGTSTRLVYRIASGRGARR